MTLTKAHIVEELFARDIFTGTDSARTAGTLIDLIKNRSKTANML